MTALPDTAPTDAELLVASVLDGDRFTAVYDRYYADVHRYVAGRLGPQTAEDVVAETFLTAFRRRARFDPSPSLPGSRASHCCTRSRGSGRSKIEPGHPRPA